MKGSTNSNFMPGYTGHIPAGQKEETFNRIQYNKHIPGYSGYIQSVKSENKYGESYGKLTNKSLNNNITKGSEVSDNDRYTSSMRETYVNQRNVKILSTAELLGVSNRTIEYKKPIPIDTINKFWGVESSSNKDEVIQLQSFQQSQRNFWSFVEENKGESVNVPDPNEAINKESCFNSGKFNPIPGYQGFNRTINAENIYGVTYSNSRRRADELLEKFSEEKAEQLVKSSRYP